MRQHPSVRPPAVAGLFYPGDPSELGKAVDELLSQARPAPLDHNLVALISPHAGYVYSGFTAANGYKLLEGKRFTTVVIVSPSHREYFDGISVYGGTAYRTPLGDVPIDEELREALVRDDKVIAESSAGHREEHALEVQLPFLQKVLRDFKILPIVIGDQRREHCFHLGEKLGTILRGRQVLLIASTDLSHYYPYDVANSLDGIVIDHVRRFDYEQLMEDLETHRAEACGGGPVVATLLAAREMGANDVHILHHCNSGDVTGDRRAVVGYLSAAVVKKN